MELVPVRRTDGFVAAATCLVGSLDRLEEMLVGLEWVLQREPAVHERAPGTDFRVAVTQAGDPALRVFYTWDETEVVLHHAELA